MSNLFLWDNAAASFSGKIPSMPWLATFKLWGAVTLQIRYTELQDLRGSSLLVISVHGWTSIGASVCCDITVSLALMGQFHVSEMPGSVSAARG